MKHLLLAISLLGLACPTFSQELYVNTEPASNMATNSLGIRVENQGYFDPYKTRTTLELMFGASRHLMVHGAVYLSDYYEPQAHFEGGSVYAKYRFLSVDSVQKKTMEATKVPGLFVIGEAVDVTGWLGGYNFQWAWASGWCAGEAA